jgi:UDP-glucose 4-epimerase
MVDSYKEIINNFYASKTVLITGASGYLGSHILNKLVETGCKIKFFSRSRQNNQKEGISYIYGSYEDKITWSKHLKDVDVIFHLASQTSLYEAEKDPFLDFNSNVNPMIVLLKELNKFDKKPFIVFAGTSTQCGIVNFIPANEDIKDNPTTVYDFHKLLAENYLKFSIRRGNVEGVSLRLCNVYGPGPKSSSHDRGIMNIMIKNALNSKDLTIYGSGEYTRDYIYIDDVVDAFLLSPINSKKVNGLHLLLGSGEGLTIKEAIASVAENINRIYQTNAVVSHIDPPNHLLQTEFRNFVSDNSLIKERLKWKPKIKFNEGILLTAKSFL